MQSKEYEINFDTSKIENFEERLEKWREERVCTGGTPDQDLKIILLEEIEAVLQLIEALANEISERKDFAPKDLAGILLKLKEIDGELQGL